jgi:hypothetical protein
VVAVGYGGVGAAGFFLVSGWSWGLVFGLGRGMNSLPVEIELEPPASGVLGTGIVPVVYEVSQGGAVEAFEGEAFGVEVFLLRDCCVSM